jgi:uncharacterized membrane protein YbaN (DUF454 family)
MADAFVRAVRQAAADCPRPDRTFSFRRHRRWSALTAFRLPDGSSLWESFDGKPGQIQLRHQGWTGDRKTLSRLASNLAEMEGIEGWRVAPWSTRITLSYDAVHPDLSRLVNRVEQSLEGMRSPGLAHLGAATDLASSREQQGRTASRSKRLGYLALAGGSLALTVVAIAVPGLPTLPCLLATSYFLARSSPWLDDRLLHTRFFGPILRDWEDHHGLSKASKHKMMGLTLVVATLSVVVTPTSPPILVLIVLAAALSLYEINRLPGIPGEKPSGIRLDGLPLLALPAP